MAAGDQRNAVISAANLLMVAMLKLNRVLVPAMLRILRSGRGRWVRRSSRDIASEMAAGGHVKKLCVGSCCGGPLASVHSHLGAGASMAAWAHPNADATDPLAKGKEKEEKEANEKEEESEDEPASKASILSDEKQPLIPKKKEEEKKPQLPTVSTTGSGPSSAVTIDLGSGAGPSTGAGQAGTGAGADPSSASNADLSEIVPASKAKPPTGLKAKPKTKPKKVTKEKNDLHLERLHIPGFSVETHPLNLPADELYFRMRVMEEERHRANQMNPAVFTSVMNVYFTLFTMFFYAFIIISVVLINFKFSNVEAILFSFSLLATATISEAETLLQPKKPPTKKKGSKKKKAAAHGAHAHKSHAAHGTGHHHHHHHDAHGKKGSHGSHVDHHGGGAPTGATILWLYKTDETKEGDKDAEKKPIPWGFLSPNSPDSGVDPKKIVTEDSHHAHHGHHGHHSHHGHHGHHDHSESESDSDSEYSD